MPLYEFECQECAQVFEDLLPAGSKKKPACPRCGRRRVQKLMSSFALRSSGRSGGSSGGSSCRSCAGGNCATCH